jgi:hypothetical protein
MNCKYYRRRDVIVIFWILIFNVWEEYKNQTFIDG